MPGCSLCQNNNFKPITKIHWLIQCCINCGLVQTHPLPDQKTINAFYQGDIAQNYLPYQSQLSIHRDYFINRIAEIEKKYQQGKILDIGCALGPFLQIAEEHGFQALGLDTSEYAVNYCKKIGLKALTGSIYIVKNQNYFDIVTAFDTLEHESDPLAMVKKTYTVLKKGGLAIFTTPNYNNWSRRILGRFWPGYRHREHLYFFTTKTLRLLFEKAGFINIKIKKDETRPFPISYLAKRMADYLPIPLIKDFFMLVSKLFKKSQLSLPFSLWDNMLLWAEK